MGRCASCGTPVLWLRAWGFGEPRPLELRPDPDGTVIIEPDEARYRMYAANGGSTTTRHRYRVHWPCPAVTGPHAGNGNGSTSVVEPLTVTLVPHTHWDREWYSPFQTFRLKLVHVVDQVLDVLEDDPSFAHFLLDGQTAMVDDYLEVRPEAESRIRRLALAGRLGLGPWHSQPDEFMVSGETLVRNLQAGMARAAELGGAMAVGYLPDSFGHIAQMPQLLRQAGIRHAVVFRGVPDAVWSTGFWWEAPDGTRVRAEHLILSYTNAYRLADDPDALLARARDLEAALGDRRVGGLLLMNGGDHEAARYWAGKTVAEANRGSDGHLRFVITGLQEYLEGQPVEGLPTWAGELRMSGPSTVIMGVTSNRMDVKLATAAAERAVERRAEPLSALLLPARDYPERLLGMAWRRLLDNAAHDSSCACSSDEVVDQVLVRYAEAREIGEGLAAEAVQALAAQVTAPGGSLLVVNPSGHTRSGLVRVAIAGRGPVHFESPGGEPLATQVLDTQQLLEMVSHTIGNETEAVLDLFGQHTFAGHLVTRWRLEPDGAELVLEMAAPGEGLADLTEPRDWLLARAAHPSENDVRVKLLQPPVRDVIAMAGPVPGFGWASYSVVEGEGPSSGVGAGEGWIRNEHLRVEVDSDDGTFAVTNADGLRVAGLNRYVDGGDGGDTYNWSPPLDDVLVDRPTDVGVELAEAGPVRARLVVTSRYPWPVPTEVRTTLDLVTGEPMVRVETEFLNAHRDHRLRAHFPLPATVTGSDAESAFAVVHRGLIHEGNPLEVGLPTYPARRFVDCSDGEVGLAIVHDGLGEYEVIEDGRELAFTLLRTVGFLSRDDGKLRPVGAGPPIPIPRAEQLGKFRRSYAVVLHRGGWEDASLHARADAVLLPFEQAWVGRTDGSRAAAGSRLSVEGAEVTAVTREGEALLVRVVRAAGTAGRVELRWDGEPALGWTVDLLGRPLAPVAGSVELRPWEIATIRLASAG
jgi:mannosylglycerate hydrolase